MSGIEEQADANLLSAFALTIGGAIGVALPLTIVIIWICSWQCFDIGALRQHGSPEWQAIRALMQVTKKAARRCSRASAS
jgi:hypothetical protein